MGNSSLIRGGIYAGLQVVVKPMSFNKNNKKIILNCEVIVKYLYYRPLPKKKKNILPKNIIYEERCH